MKNSSTNLGQLDKESPEYRKVRYELYHTDLGLKCPICGKRIENLSLLGEHMRELHANTYRTLQLMKRKACALFIRRCKTDLEKKIVQEIDSEILSRLNVNGRKVGKRRKPGEPRLLPWPKMKRDNGCINAWSKISNCSNPIVFSSTR